MSLQNTCNSALVPSLSQSGRMMTINTSTHAIGVDAGFVTAPPSSATATGSFGTSLTVGVAKQNTLGYNILVNLSVAISSSVGGSLLLGVGSSSTPTTNAATNGITTLVGIPPIILSAVIPDQYYLLLDTSGTITIGSVTLQSCPL